MRIGIDVRSLTDREPSGVGTYVWHIVKNLVELVPDHEFKLFFSGWSVNLADNSRLQALARYKNVKLVHWRWPNKFYHGLAWLGLAPRLDKIVGGVDGWFAPNLHFLPLSKNIPLILTVHDLSFALFPEFLSWRRRMWHRAVCSRKLFQRAKHLIAVSQTTKHDLEQVYKISPDKITVIYPGVPEAVTASPTETNINLLDLPKRYILLLATLEPRKNVLASLVAFQHFCALHKASDLHLVVVGSAGWKSKKILQAIQTTPRAHYLGYVTAAQKAAILQQAIGLLYPSIYEGFGFPPLEALQYGVPVIASHVGALPEVLQNAVYYINPYSVAEISAALHEFDVNTALRAQLTQAGQAVIKNYAWQKSARQILEIFSQI
ncbi:MAG: glycosyltransferase family 1 protein [Patescibacteria group bacterium]|jgi:glycosyltransferase involved in cell wall biosynthesis